MKKLIVLSSLGMLSLSADDRLSQLKSAIVRSDVKAVEMLLSEGHLGSSLHELGGWADDLIEERALLVPTQVELAGGYLGLLGLGALSCTAVLYWFNRQRLVSFLACCGITSNKTMLSVIAGCCTTLSLYGISRKVRGPKKRLESAHIIKNGLEQLILHRKEQ